MQNMKSLLSSSFPHTREALWAKPKDGQKSIGFQTFTGLSQPFPKAFIYDDDF